MAEGRIYGGEIWGGGDDGSALIYSVNRTSTNRKFVAFKSIESNKSYSISKPHFKARFPVKLKEQ